MLLIVHDQQFPRNDRQELLVIGLLNAKNLVGLSCIRLLKFNGKLLDLIESLRVIHDNFVSLRHQECVESFELEAFGPLAILLGGWDQEVVLVLALVNLNCSEKTCQFRKP